MRGTRTHWRSDQAESKRGIIISAVKMMMLNIDYTQGALRPTCPNKPFFPGLCESMVASPVVCMVLKGVDVVSVFRTMVSATNGRKAAPGTLRGDF